MLAQNKSKRESTPNPQLDQGDRVETESQDEIEQIMSEIEELQQEMNTAATPKAKSAAPAPNVPTPPARPKAAPPQVEAMKTDPKSELNSQDEASTSDEMEQDILKDFSGEGEEPWLEETLANLKDPQSIGETQSDSARSPNEPTQDELEKELAAEREAVERMIEEESAAATELAQELQTAAPPVQRTRSQPPSQAAPHFSSLSPSAAGGSLGLTIEGNMTLKLSYAAHSRQMSIHFSEHSVFIQLSDGTELKLPIK